MDPPFGHHHHHQHRRDDGEEEYPPPPVPPTFDPPPSYYPQNEPPPQVYHSSHVGLGGGREERYPPPAAPSSFDPTPPSFRPPYYAENEPPLHGYHRSHVESHPHPPRPVSEEFYAPPPPPHVPPSQGGFNYSDSVPYEQPPPPSSFYSSASSVHHVSHDLPLETETNPHHHRPHLPSFMHHHTHNDQSPELANKPTVRLFSKAETNHSLSIRDGKVILATSNPSDPFQHWIKDEKFSTRVKDEEGFPCFSLVNKATGQAMKHSIGATHPVQLIPYNPDVLDESVLWTESRDLGDGFRTIRMVNNIRLNVDAFNGDKNHGGVHDGTTIVLWEWKKGDNQRWKIVPY